VEAEVGGMIVRRLAEREALASRSDVPLRIAPAAVPVPQRRTRSVGDYRSPAGRALKRGLDLLAAVAVLVLTAPLSLLIALLIKLEDRGPVFFRQRRVGLGGEIFILRKFRSMRVDAEAETGPVWAQEDDPRVTRVGRWIRLLHVDEIPQAWNVLRGDMSFVGPRPERPEFVGELRSAIPFYDYRHAVRPGITGWAQVHVPHTATVEDVRRKLTYDLDYLRHFSLRMDLAIMLRTLRLIILGWRRR
jgi:lipopolysaccharide/colanic/teichoic acid biosynthesis glycosyltransferase